MTVSDSIDNSLSADVVQGHDVQSVLYQIALSLNQGVPDNWQRLMHSPITNGSSNVEMIISSDLKSTITSWGLADDMRDKAHRDINALIKLAVGKSVYLAKGFSYNWSNCLDVPHPACLSTLFVVVKVPYMFGDYVWKVELAHIYIASAAETIEQYTYSHTCHRCMFKTCCHDSKDPRSLDSQELQDVLGVMSTSQSDWALDHIPQQTDLHARPELSRSSSDVLWPNGGFDALLRTIIENITENRDVYKTHKGGLLKAIQNATLSHNQDSNNMQLTVNEKDIIPMLEDMLSRCFRKAGIQKSIEGWWRHAYAKNRNDPISIECEFASQRTESIMPPSAGCTTSTNVTLDTSYSWLLVAPRNGRLDVLYLESNLEVTFRDCEPNGNQDQTDNNATVHDNRASGSMVRWGYVDSNGSFGSIKYLAEWKFYSSYVNKALLDFLRFASAASYLKVPPHVYFKTSTLVLPQQQDPQPRDDTDMVPLVMSPSFTAIMESIKLFAETWDKVAKAIGSSTTTTIKRRVCLGFDALDYNATSSVMQRVDVRKMPLLVEDVVDIEDLPKRNDIKRLMSGIKYSTNFTWIAESMTFTSPNGRQSYMFFAKYGDATTGMADVVYSMVKSSFVLAPDMLIVHRQKTGPLGLSRSDETSIEYVPHTLTLNDTLILEMFWEMIAFHQLAISLGAEPPKYPDLSGLCDRSIP
ncbi:hypothetical protein BGZ46_000220 [Entomortierella lignicola]|nr:hypothetical protein BGZ46_000220 [Entomortierella lignicola]